MFETYRMLGRAHQDELERTAAPLRASPVTHGSLVMRLLKRLSGPRSIPGKTGRISSIAPSEAGDAPASAALRNP